MVRRKAPPSEYGCGGNAASDCAGGINTARTFRAWVLRRRGVNQQKWGGKRAPQLGRSAAHLSASFVKSQPDIVVHPLGVMVDVVSTLFRLFRAAAIHRGAARASSKLGQQQRLKAISESVAAIHDPGGRHRRFVPTWAISSEDCTFLARLLTAGTMIAEDLSIKLENVTLQMLGKAKRVRIEKENTNLRTDAVPSYSCRRERGHSQR